MKAIFPNVGMGLKKALFSPDEESLNVGIVYLHDDLSMPSLKLYGDGG